jgi:ATP-dependent Clp protease ATP-binding subunit ClpX
MVSTLAQILQVPFAVVDATSLSQTGYVGLDPEECLVRLYQAAEQDVAKAEHGIIFIDEVDKIGRKTGEDASTTRDVSGEGVQQALLKIIEGNVVKFTPGGARKHPQGEFVTMNTKNILFILGGAFDGIQHVIQQRAKQDHSQIGFLGQVHVPDSDQNTWRLLQQVDTEDLISYGMIPELVGRIPIILPFESLDVHMLTRILTEPKNAILKQFQAQFKLEGIQLEVMPEACVQIAQQVIDTKTGARGLRRVLEKTLMNSLYQVHALVKSGVHTIRITPECILSGAEPEHVIDSP